MKSTLALVAMATAATANASASDAVLANAMAFAKDTRKLFDANNGRRVLADDESTTYLKGKCVKGQATDIASMKSAGIDLVIPTTGYCMNSAPTSMLLTCDGVTLNAQQVDVIDCKGITKNTTKLDMSSGLGPCVKGEVEGVHLNTYTKSDCSDAAGTLIVAADSCMGGTTKISCKSDKITAALYAADSKCTGDAEGTVTFTSGDDKCHAPTSSASSVTLTAGMAFAGLIASLALM